MSNMTNDTTSGASELFSDVNDPANDPVALILTDGEVGALMQFIHELTLGPKAPSDEEWKWMENVQDLPSVDYYQKLLEKLNKFRIAAITYNGR